MKVWKDCEVTLAEGLVNETGGKSSLQSLQQEDELTSLLLSLDVLTPSEPN